LAAFCVALAAATTGAVWYHAAPTFPHDKHAKLFPSCASCHSGITTGDATKIFPSRAVCARCHDGTIVQTVAWTQPAARATNLRFSHELHATAAAEAG